MGVTIHECGPERSITKRKNLVLIDPRDEGRVCTRAKQRKPCYSRVAALGLSVLEPVGRLGSFGVTERRKTIGFRFPHHVYEHAYCLL